jgi:hypothetical protein
MAIAETVVQLQTVIASQFADHPSPLRCPAASPSLAVQATLVEQGMLLRSELHSCLTRVESFLVSARAALGTFDVAPQASFPAELMVGSADVGEEGLFGGFSPVLCPASCRNPMWWIPPRVRSWLR